MLLLENQKGTELFKSDLQNNNWKVIERIDELNEAVCKWEELLLEVVDKHMPLKTKRVRKKHSPWIDEPIFSLIDERDKTKDKAKSK